MTQHHYIFGYGSLICKHSRALTTKQSRAATPVLVKGLERVWSVRAPTFCAMGVQFRPDAECVGVLVPVKSSDDLARLDERELGYERVAVDNDNVTRVPFLEEEHYAEDEHDIVFENKSQIHVWVYVPEDAYSAPPSQESPLVQSYVDTIMRGCLQYNEQFVVSFLQKTAGWHTPHYVDDRSRPIYPRGDQDWSLQHASRLDDLLQTHVEDTFQNRRRI